MKKGFFVTLEDSFCFHDSPDGEGNQAADTACRLSRMESAAKNRKGGEAGQDSTSQNMEAERPGAGQMFTSGVTGGDQLPEKPKR